MAPADESASPEKTGAGSPSRLERPLPWAMAWLGWLITLGILSSMSQPGPRIDIVGIDKVYHAVYFAIGGTLLLLAVTLRRNSARAALKQTPWGKAALAVLLAGAVIGGLDEWYQSHTPGRQGLDVYDWIADLTGSLAAVPLARLVLAALAARHPLRT